MPKVIQLLSNETKTQSDLKAYILSTRHAINLVPDRNCVLSLVVLTTHYWDDCPFFITPRCGFYIVNAATLALALQ